MGRRRKSRTCCHASTSGYRYGTPRKFRNVYTRPSHRRRGFAGRIMAALTDAARAMDLSVVELKATQEGYPLYRKAGFHDDRSKYRPMRWENRHDR